MAEKIAFENGLISNFEGLVTLTLDRVILHTVVHYSLTSTYMPNFIEIEETFCGWEDVRTSDVFTDGHLRPALSGRLCRRVDLKMLKWYNKERQKCTVKQGGPCVCIGECRSHEGWHTSRHIETLCSTGSHVLSYHSGISCEPSLGTETQTKPCSFLNKLIGWKET